MSQRVSFKAGQHNEKVGFTRGVGAGLLNSLAPADQQLVERRLRTSPSKYIENRIQYPRVVKRVRKGQIEYDLQDAPKPEFLRKTPPWYMHPAKT
jgi:hypothetical protein